MENGPYFQWSLLSESGQRKFYSKIDLCEYMVVFRVGYQWKACLFICAQYKLSF